MAMNKWISKFMDKLQDLKVIYVYISVSTEALSLCFQLYSSRQKKNGKSGFDNCAIAAQNPK